MIILVDIDGTLAIRDGRGPYEWSSISSDVPNTPIIELLLALADRKHEIVYISGRHEDLRSATNEWLSNHVGVPGRLLMRKNDDFRSDELIKREIVTNNIEDLNSILLVIDDRDRVVKMWRGTLGLTCLQVAEGNF